MNNVPNYFKKKNYEIKKDKKGAVCSGEKINIYNKYGIAKEEFEQFIDKSPNEMDYDEAINDDNRTFLEMYKDYLFDNHFLLNCIFEKDKYKPTSLKMIIYNLRIGLFYVINGLFYNDSYIDELYNSDKEETFFSFIPRSIERIVYISIISGIIDFIVDFFIVSGDKIRKVLVENKTNKILIKGTISNIANKISKSIIIFIYY